jgi:hypothetical protein
LQIEEQLRQQLDNQQRIEAMHALDSMSIFFLQEVDLDLFR